MWNWANRNSIRSNIKANKGGHAILKPTSVVKILKNTYVF